MGEWACRGLEGLESTPRMACRLGTSSQPTGAHAKAHCNPSGVEHRPVVGAGLQPRAQQRHEARRHHHWLAAVRPGRQARGQGDDGGAQEQRRVVKLRQQEGEA